MFHKLSFLLKLTFLSILVSSFIAACGDSPQRRRPELAKNKAAGTAQTDTTNTNTDTKTTTDTNTNADTKSDTKADTKSDSTPAVDQKKTTSPKGTVEQIAKLNQVDLMLKSENQVSKQEIWKSKSKSITNNINSLSLKITAGNNGKNMYAAEAIVKLSKDNSVIGDRWEFQSAGELSFGDLSKDVELTVLNSDAKITGDEIKKTLGKVELRFMVQSNEYLLQIIRADGAEAAIIFDHDGKAIQVLGQEADNDTLIKKLNRSSILAEKLNSKTTKVKSAENILKLADAEIAKHPELIEALKEKRQAILETPSKIRSDLDAVRNNQITILRAEVAEDANGAEAARSELTKMKTIALSNVENLKSVIAASVEILKQQIAKVGADSDAGKAIQSQILDRWSNINIDITSDDKKDATGEVVAPAQIPGRLNQTH